ncbi:MAG: response regulator transcription factor [Candidatus Auribacterota bacterium]|nr:response regulator transcription factor [Candidatus Auribacterota bacterium]
MKNTRTIIVDDNPGFRKVLRRVFRSYPFIEVVGEAENGELTIDQVKNLGPDLVTLDINLPGMDGFELARLLHKTYPGTRIIFITLNGNPVFRRAAVRMGCPYVTKETLLEDLSQVMDDFLPQD